MANVDCCFYCGTVFDQKDAKLQRCRDHVVPTSRGGSDDLSNIVICCRTCNSSKGTRSIEDYRAMVQLRRCPATRAVRALESALTELEELGGREGDVVRLLEMMQALDAYRVPVVFHGERVRRHG